MRRILALLPVLLAFQVGVSPALAWTWPVAGPVLRPFAFDRDNPYAGGQHRGADIGAAVGGSVVAPVAGTVTFAGSIPGGGLTVAIRTGDGYSATLVHLGSLAVARGATIREGATVGVVGSTGQAELGAPHVHLGVRIAADEHGYVDPLGFLRGRLDSPPPAEPAPSNGATPKSSSESSSSAPKEGARARGAPSAGMSGGPRRVGRRDGRRFGRDRGAVRQAATANAASASLFRRVALAGSAPATLEAAPRSVVPANPGPPALGWALVALLVTAAGAAALGAALARRPPATAEDAHEGLERILLAEAKALDRPQGCPRSHRRGGPHLSVRSPRSFPAGESETASRDDQRASV